MGKNSDLPLMMALYKYYGQKVKSHIKCDYIGF